MLRVIIARYDIILYQSENAHLYNRPSNYTTNNIRNIFKPSIIIILLCLFWSWWPAVKGTFYLYNYYFTTIAYFNNTGLYYIIIKQNYATFPCYKPCKVLFCGQSLCKRKKLINTRRNSTVLYYTINNQSPIYC